MQKKKICMVGDFAVGKTSLTQRFVNNCFEDKYLTTIGVKIDSAIVSGTKVIVWDVAGRDSLSPINSSYLVGASGIVLVADGTRTSTIDALDTLWETCKARIGEVPVVIALNKRDHPDWRIEDTQLKLFDSRGWSVFETSAKEDKDVEVVYTTLLEKIRI